MISRLVFVLTLTAVVVAANMGFNATAQNQTLWYRQPAGDWNEALPLGNSRLGAMVFGKVEDEVIQLNEGTLWAGVPHDYSVPAAHESLPEIRRLLFAGREDVASQLADRTFMGNPRCEAAYQPLGDLRLVFPSSSPAANYRRELDLTRGIATVSYRSGGTTFTREYFISHPDKVMVLRLTADKPHHITLDVSLSSQHPNSHRTEGDNRLVLEGRWKEDGKPKSWTATWDEPGMRFATAVQAQNHGGSIKADANGLHIVGANAVTLYLAAGTSFLNFRDISGNPSAEWPQVIANAVAKGFDRLRKRHVKRTLPRSWAGSVSISGKLTAARNQQTNASRL